MGDPAKANDKIGTVYRVFSQAVCSSESCWEDKYDAYSLSVTEGYSNVHGFCNMT